MFVQKHCWRRYLAFKPPTLPHGVAVSAARTVGRSPQPKQTHAGRLADKPRRFDTASTQASQPHRHFTAHQRGKQRLCQPVAPLERGKPKRGARCRSNLRQPLGTTAYLPTKPEPPWTTPKAATPQHSRASPWPAARPVADQVSAHLTTALTTGATCTALHNQKGKPAPQPTKPATLCQRS